MEDPAWSCSAAKKPRLTGEDYEQLKQRLRERKRKFSKVPRIRLLAAGENARTSVDPECRIPIFLSDVQHLLLYSVVGNKAPYLPERWCKLDKCNQVQHAVVCVVEGLTLDHYQSHRSTFQHVTSKLDHSLELITPTVYGGSVVEELATVPLTGTERAKLLAQFGTLESALEKKSDILKLFSAIFPMQIPASTVNGTETENAKLPVTDKFSRTELILSPAQLIDGSFPVPLKGGLEKKYSNYVLTKDEYAAVHSKSKMYGVDCEMCETTGGLKELTRISIVDEHLNTVYDTLVKPDNVITNYLTPYSGITKDMLKDVTTKLSDVQKFIRNFLPADAILVGQSLENDLKALKMMHPYIIDTSVIFNMTGYRYCKTKLKTLASMFLNETIQNSKDGHCSVEDSAASMKLVKLKLANSIDFGDTILENSRPNSYVSNSYVSRYKKDNRVLKPKPKTENYSVGSFICNRVTKDAKTAAIFGCMETIKDYSKFFKNTSLSIMDDNGFQKGDNVRLVIAKSNKETITRCSEVAMEHALNLCHIKLTKEELTEENINKTLSSVDKWVRKLWKHTAQYGLVCVIFSGEKNSSNGACFFTIKKEIDTENVCESS